MNNEYAVSIRRRYIMPDHTFDGYELVLWHWDVIENTWLFRATRDYPISKRVSRLYALWKVLRDAQKLARIFQCKNYATNEEGMWGGDMNDIEDSDHELTDEQRDKLRKAIGEIIGDFTPWILCVDTTPIIGDSRVSYSSNVSSEHASVYELIGLMESTKADFLQ